MSETDKAVAEEAVELTDADIDEIEKSMPEIYSMPLGLPMFAGVCGIFIGAVVTMFAMRRSVSAPGQLLG